VRRSRRSIEFAPPERPVAERIGSRLRPQPRRNGPLMRALHLDFLRPAGPRRIGWRCCAGVAAAVLVAWRFLALGRDVDELEAPSPT
jgi:hypothetical protein